MSLLQIIQKRCGKGKDVSYSKSAKIYTLGEPYEDSEKNAKWSCEAAANEKLKTYTDPEVFKSLDELCEKLEKLINDHVSNRKRKLNEDIELHKPKSHFITEACLYKCLEKCLKEENYYSRTGLNFLIQNQFITNLLHNLMVDCIVKYGDIDLLKNVTIFKFKEVTVLKLLKYVISTMAPEEEEKILSNVNMENLSLDFDVIDKLMIILLMEVNFVVMREQLKLLMANEAIVLLQLLRYMLFQVSSAFIGDSEFLSTSKKAVTERNVVQWIDALISAQMMSFATSPLIKPIIERLQRDMKNQVAYYGTIGTLVPFLDALQKAYELPPYTKTPYSIQTIRL